MSLPSDRRLYVEGVNDREFIYQLCNSHQLENQRWFEVKVAESHKQVRDAIKQASKAGGNLRRLGAVIDADLEPEARWRSLVNAVSANGYVLPSGPPSEPMIIAAPTADQPSLGIWMMPDNLHAGMLEDFAQRLIRASDPVWPHARSAATKIKEELPEDQRFKDVHLSKAQLHTWLAWKDEPGRPMGQALKFGMLDNDHALAARLAAWLRELFIEP